MHRLVVFFFIFLPSHLFAQRTSIRPPSIMSSGWEELTSQSKIDSIYNFFVQTVKSFDSQSNKNVKYRARDLPFYNDADLIEIEVHKNQDVELYNFVEIEDQFVLLNGNTNIIHAINEHFGIILNSESSYLDYAEFFMGCMQADMDKKFIAVREIESVEHLFNKEDSHDVEEAFITPKILNANNDSCTLELTAFFAQTLFNTELQIWRNGSVQMLDDTTTLKAVSIYNTYFSHNGAIIIREGQKPNKAQLEKNVPAYPNLVDSLGRRQGKWVLLYNNVWEPETDNNRVFYYRIIEYLNDELVGKVRDYYSNGQLKMDGELITDRPEEIYRGGATWYNINGNIETVKYFDDNGDLIGEFHNTSDTIGYNLLNQKGIENHKKGNYKIAQFWFSKAIDYFKTNISEKNLDLAVVQENLAETYFKLGKDSIAILLYVNALKVQEDVIGKDNVEYAKSLNHIAGLYKIYGNYEQAEFYFQETLNVLERIGEGQHPDYALVLWNLAGIYQEQHLYQKAETAYLKSLNICRSGQYRSDPDYITLLVNIIDFYAQQSQDIKAEPFYLELLELQKKQLGILHPDYLETLKKLAKLYYSNGNYFKVEPLYQEILNINKEVLGKRHPNYAASLNDMASLYSKMGNYTKAESLYLEALGDYENVLEEQNPNYLTSLNNLIKLYCDQDDYANCGQSKNDIDNLTWEQLNKNGNKAFTKGNYNEAVAWLKKAIIVAKNDSVDFYYKYAQSFYNLGLVYRSQVKYSNAEQLFYKAIDISLDKFGKQHPIYATSIQALAGIYQLIGEYNTSELLYFEALSIYKENLDDRHPKYANLLNDIAVLYAIQGKYNKAEEYYNNAASVLKFENEKDYAIVLTNLASLYLFQGKSSLAEPLLKQAAQIQKDEIGEKHPDYLFTLGGLAIVCQNNGDYAKAEIFLKNILRIRKELYGTNHPIYASSIYNLGRLYYDQGNYSDAERLYLEALSIRSQILGGKNLDYSKSLHSLALTYLLQEKYAEAELCYKKLINVFSLQKKNLSFLSENEKNSYLNVNGSYQLSFQTFVTNYYKYSPAILTLNYNLKLSYKSFLFSNGQEIKRLIEQSDDKGLKKIYKNLIYQRQYLANLYQMSNEKLLTTGINIEDEENKANQLEKTLSELIKLPDTEYTWKDVRNQLKDGEAAIEMVRFRYYDKTWTDSVMYMAMIVTSDTKEHPELVVLPNGNELEGKYLNYYKGSINADYLNEQENNRGVKVLNFTTNSQSPYEAYWKPIREKLEGIKKVYLSPDGVYNTINVSALYNLKDSTYVFDQLEIQQVTSTRDLVVPKRTIRNTNEAILVGYPDYNSDQTADSSMYNDWQQQNVFAESRSSGIRFFNGEDIAPLPNTKTEIKHLSNTFSNTGIKPTILLDSIATEANVLQVDNPRILHIATHGFFLKDMEPDTTNRGMLMGMDEHQVFENPLLRSGLLLAHAKQAIKEGGDGVLTAYEAMNMNLNNTELVVLSACETGLGEVKNGEGVYGLQRAFQTAGARNVLMSLWNVSDEATMELMILFYDNWLKKKQTKREAFRNAQLELRKKYPEPYYWASFVMIGE